MFHIKDLEEKRCIMAFYKCQSNKNCKNIFTNSSIYNDWWRWWGMDFPKKNSGKPMQIYRNQFVVSAKKSRKGITSSLHTECTNTLSSITKWITQNYNKQYTRKENKQRFYEMLTQLRKDNYENLLHILNHEGLVEKGYSIQDTSSASANNIYDLRNYCLIHVGDTITVKNGSYETILEHLQTLVEEKEDN